MLRKQLIFHLSDKAVRHNKGWTATEPVETMQELTTNDALIGVQ